VAAAAPTGALNASVRACKPFWASLRAFLCCPFGASQGASAGPPQPQPQPIRTDEKYLIDGTLGKSPSVQAEMVDVAHGKLSPESDSATLIVIKFRFQPGAYHKRFRYARIAAKFSGMNPNKLA
jgi:hypothetical protein